MTSSLLQWIESIIVPWGAWGVFVGSVAEEIIVPIPSAMVQAGAGFFLLSGIPFGSELFLKLVFLILIPASFGVALGSLPVYALGRFLGRPAVEKYGAWMSITIEDVDRFAQKISVRNRVLPLIVFVRMLPVLPSAVVSIVAGILNVPLLVYLLASVLGTAVRASILGILGALVGAAYTHFAETIDRFEKFGLLLLLCVVVVLWMRKKRHSMVLPPQ